MGKPVILLFAASYLPGYKSGGILRTIVNTVDQLNKYYDFKIVTLDRDLGDKQAYSTIKTETWLKIGNAEVFYLEKNRKLVGKIKKLIQSTEYDIIHLNSFFDPIFTIRIIYFHWLGLFKKKPILLAPRGEFNKTQLKFKWRKKQVYILLFRIFKLDKGIVYQASDQQEANDISKVLGIPFLRIRKAKDLLKSVSLENKIEDYSPQNGMLKVLFLSRISREKNLKYAIEVFQKVDDKICFHIYGPIEDVNYWEECKIAIKQMPENVRIEYCGALTPEKVDGVMQKYDLFFLPTFSENFGHVIAEALANGLPVLISNGTPWKQLDQKGFGWDIDLNDELAFIRAIEEFSKTSAEQRIENRLTRKKVFADQLSISDVVQENIDLYRNIIG